ncbi:MAG: hypothetical protein KIS67_22250 [Verrucomicrobiae bacterium]|nr:hypothetical protein [Verrucomicrobiae bacterium]
MRSAEPDNVDGVESFLAGEDGGLLRRWALVGFRLSLPRAVQAEGLEIGSVKRRGDCLRFTVLYPPGRQPSAKPKLRMFVHRMIRRTGWRVPDRSLWFKLASRRRGLVVCAVPDWRGED